MTAYAFVVYGDCLLSKTVEVDAKDVEGALAAFAALSPGVINALAWEPGALTVHGVSVHSEDDAADAVDLDQDFCFQLEMLFG